jgi:hypothetical protein
LLALLAPPSEASGRAGNLDLDPPLYWKVYGDPYTISS